MLGLFTTLLGGLMGGLGSMLGSQANYAQNARLMEQQNKYNIDMWKMNNEYNTPQAQMQRFQDAGLNPNLIYGMGSAEIALHLLNKVSLNLWITSSLKS